MGLFGKPLTVQQRAEKALEEIDRSIYTQRLLVCDAQQSLHWLETKRALLTNILGGTAPENNDDPQLTSGQ